MAAEPYLFRLGARLTHGLGRLNADRRAKHRDFFLDRINADGGFRGRDSESDLYYTGFGVRGLALLGALETRECVQIAGYLAQRTDMHVSVVDLVSWLYCALMVQLHGQIDVLEHAPADWPDRLAQLLESFRTADGGYAKTHDGAAGSTYHSFLVTACYELIGRSVPEPDRLCRFLFDRQRDDGGFVEIAPMKRSGTNPTAAAVAVLQILGAVDATLRDDVCAYLREVRSDDGGFQANTRVPFGDSLSTFTGLLTAVDLGLNEIVDRTRLEAFLAQLEFPDGGFRGAAWDTAADVEYSFYSLGILGLMNGLSDGFPR